VQADVLERPVARPQVKWTRIVLPTEHGSWSFLLEPLVAGTAIASSAAAPWIAVMTVAAFFLRQPLKVFYLSRRNNPALNAAAMRFLAVFLGIAAVGLAASVWTAGWWVLFPFAVAAPLAIQQVFFDLSSRNRSLLGEISGAVAISSSAAALLLAGGTALPAAAALWVVFACRSVPSVLYVRERLLLEKGKEFQWFLPVAAHAVGLAGAVALASDGLVPWLTSAVIAFLAFRSTSGLSHYRTRMKAMKIGLWEVAYGALFVGSIIAGHYVGI
jgi:hypothetical protein